MFVYMNLVACIFTIVLAIIGLSRVICKIVLKLRKYVTWNQIVKWNHVLIEEIRKDKDFVPSCILSMGRGGAVMAALMSKKLIPNKMIPIFMIDRVFHEKGYNKSVQIMTDSFDIKNAPEKILLVAGMNVEGLTLKNYRSWLEMKGVEPSNIKSAVLIESTHPICKADYVYKTEVVDPANLKMPWYKNVGADWARPFDFS